MYNNLYNLHIALCTVRYPANEIDRFFSSQLDTCPFAPWINVGVRIKSLHKNFIMERSLELLVGENNTISDDNLVLN